MILRPGFRVVILCFLLLSLAPLHASAQSLIDPNQLPIRTAFYLAWHGTPSGDVRARNSLYALWDDPDFVPARSALIASLVKPDAAQKGKPALTRDEAAQYATLLDNAFLIGYLRKPEFVSAAKSAAPTNKPAWNGMFFIYDRSGKEELLSKAVLRLRSANAEIPKLTNLTVAGVPALKVEGKNGTNYWAEFGKYAVAAQDQPVFEEIVALLNGKAAEKSLSQLPAFVEAKPLLSGGVVEFFLNISNLKELALASSGNSAATLQFAPFLNALHIESLHSLAGKLSLEGTRTRIQGGILGDAVPGSFFDMFAEGQANPASLAYFFPDTVYYSESQIDLLGLYKVLKSAFGQLSGGANQTNPLEAAAAARLGMPLEDALKLPTGEFTSLQTNPSADNTQQVYFLGIRSKPDTLKLARTLMGERIASERNENSVTYLKISLQGGQSGAGVAQWNFYHLAVTPNAILGAQKNEILRTYLEKASAAGADPPASKAFQAMRTQFPEKVSGLTFVDFQKLDWVALKAKWIAEANKAAKNGKTDDATKAGTNVPSWLSQVNPDLVPRHLHTLAGASWKDAKGVHFDEWLE